jgi:MFS family permease
LTEGTQNRLAVATVLGNELFYSINWYSIPPVFYLIALDFHAPVSGLGLISSAFLVGIGFFQIPGAVFSAKFGARRLCLIGMVLLSVSVMLCALASSIDLIALLRFFSGMGMALFFSSSIALMTRSSRAGRAGFVLGLSNAVAAVGGGIGLLGWAIIGASIGWRLSLVLIGGLGLVSAAFLFLNVPRDAPARDFKLNLPDLRRVLLDRWLLVVGCVLLAYDIGNTLAATFAEVYLHDSLGVSAGASGAIGSLVIFSGLFTAPIAGHFHNRVVRVKPVLVASGLAIAGGVAIASLATPTAVLVSAVTVGLASGVGYTFAAAWDSSALRAQRTIALSWVNCIQLLFSFWAPYLFSFVVLGYGYHVAWLTGGLYTAVLILPLVLSHGRPAPRAEVG